MNEIPNNNQQISNKFKFSKIQITFFWFEDLIFGFYLFFEDLRFGDLKFAP